ncbi:MAG TPA: hypothetical protein VKA60_18790 [Blastocatellia bacterium]|nr:hypothetical protein [Blastocatellia bacterium]
MKKTIGVVVLGMSLALPALALQSGQQTQTSTNAKATTNAQAQAEGKSAQATLDAGTEIQAEMASTLDLRKAKPGDPFKMKTTRPIKRDGKEAVSRGSIINGHVDKVTRADNQTTATLVFDTIQDKKTQTTAPLAASVTAISRATQHVAATGNDEMMAPAPRQSAPRQQQSGGLLGGVTNTVGGAVGTVGGTADATLGTTVGSTVGAGGLAGSAIQIVTDTTATATSGSTLQAAGKNTRIDSGTQFILRTTSSVIFADQTKKQSQ